MSELGSKQSEGRGETRSPPTPSPDGIAGWIESRSGLVSATRSLLDRAVPDGRSVGHVLGVVALYLLAQQVVLGVLLATYFSPSLSSAWASTAFIQDRVTMGWFIRGLHHHGSGALVTVIALHLIRGVYAGAYRAPRELTWWAGLGLGGLVFLLAHTGYQLPWDHRAYTATSIATGLAGSVPGGHIVRDLLVGGADFGNLTITRFYVLHVFVLPICVALLILLHIRLVRRHGQTPNPRIDAGELPKRAKSYAEGQLVLDLVAMAVVGCGLLALTIYTHGAELGPPADPAAGGVARPVWYDLFLYQLLKYFEGPAQILAVVVIPGLTMLFLFALPWLDRSASPRPERRVGVLAGVAMIFAGIVALTAIALVEDAGNAEYQEKKAEMQARAERARELARVGVLAEGGPAVYRNDPDHRALELFAERCGACHSLGPHTSGNEAPDLTKFSSREWLVGAVREPRSERYFGGTKVHKDMAAYSVDELSDANLDDVVEFMLSLRGDPAITLDTDKVARGRALWEGALDCSTCHETQAGLGTGPAPNLAGRGSLEWIVAVIQDPSAPTLYGKDAAMPAFKTKLSAAEIDQLAALIHRQGLPATAK